MTRVRFVPRTRQQKSVSTPDRLSLSHRFCELFQGVCADCPNSGSGRRERRKIAEFEDRLPPFAIDAIAALARCRGLTKREREVLTLCCGGLKNDAMARALRISRSGVRRHLRHLHEKTNTADKCELILNLWHSIGMCLAEFNSSRPHRPDAASRRKSSLRNAKK